jgi:predicted metalloendopeptidase
MTSTLPLTLAIALLCTPALIGQTTPEFREAAVDSSKDSCVDFYQHAAGSWISHHPIPPHLPTYGTGNVVAARTRETLKRILEENSINPTAAERSARAYYASCMELSSIEAEGLRPLRAELEAINRIRTPNDAGRRLAELQAIGVSNMYTAAPQVDREDAQKKLIVFRPAAGRLGRSDYLGTSPRSAELRPAYALHIARVLSLSGVPEAEAVDAATQIVELETRLASATLTLPQRRDVAATWHVMSLEEFNKIAPTFAPARLFEVLKVEPPQRLNVTEPRFFEVLERELSSESIIVWKFYLRFLLLDSYASTLPRAFVNEAEAFRAVKVGVTRPRPRWQECVAAVDSDLGPLLGDLYARATLRDDTKQRVGLIARNLTEAWGKMIDEATWLAPETRGRARAKLANIRWNVGGPAASLNDVPLVKRDAYASVARAVVKQTMRRLLLEASAPSSPSDWTISPAEPNAMFDQVRLAVFVTAAELQPPYFDAAADEAWNYGALGAVLGHELSHAFDDKGSRFNERGEVLPWWTEEDRAKFAARVSCTKERLGRDRLGELSLDAEAVVGEAIADRAGLKAAFRAYTTAYPDPPVIAGLTGRQRFFLAFAQMYARQSRAEWIAQSMQDDTHAPDELRVLEAIRGMPEFAAAFGCTSEPVCEVW